MPFCFRIRYFLLLIYVKMFEGKTEFGPGEDAHVIGDCVKVMV